MECGLEKKNERCMEPSEVALVPSEDRKEHRMVAVRCCRRTRDKESDKKNYVHIIWMVCRGWLGAEQGFLFLFTSSLPIHTHIYVYCINPTHFTVWLFRVWINDQPGHIYSILSCILCFIIIIRIANIIYYYYMNAEHMHIVLTDKCPFFTFSTHTHTH